jgi:hypothetical protein
MGYDNNVPGPRDRSGTDEHGSERKDNVGEGGAERSAPKGRLGRARAVLAGLVGTEEPALWPDAGLSPHG